MLRPFLLDRVEAIEARKDGFLSLVDTSVVQYQNTFRINPTCLVCSMEFILKEVYYGRKYVCGHLAYRHKSQELQDPSLFMIHVIQVDHGDNSGFRIRVVYTAYQLKTLACQTHCERILTVCSPKSLLG